MILRSAKSEAGRALPFTAGDVSVNTQAHPAVRRTKSASDDERNGAVGRIKRRHRAQTRLCAQRVP